MAQRTPMQKLARWHIWLGWAAALPILVWLISGLLMAARPIEEVRGNHLKIEAKQEMLPPGSEIVFAMPPGKPVKSIATSMEDGKVVTRLEFADGTVTRYGEDGAEMPLLDEAAARAVVARSIKGGDKVVSATLFPKDKVPFDFRREMPVWQVVLADGAHVYVGQQSGKVEAVRTRWWRIYDFFWGLHIMDPMGRENAYNPFVWVFGAIALVLSLFGAVLLFRRRRAGPGSR